jgi:hypothetical protein
VPHQAPGTCRQAPGTCHQAPGTCLVHHVVLLVQDVHRDGPLRRPAAGPAPAPATGWRGRAGAAAGGGPRHELLKGHCKRRREAAAPGVGGGWGCCRAARLAGVRLVEPAGPWVHGVAPCRAPCARPHQSAPPGCAAWAAACCDSARPSSWRSPARTQRHPSRRLRAPPDDGPSDTQMAPAPPSSSLRGPR